MASEREIFDHARTILDARQRAEYLQQACGEGEALREHIETLPSIAANRHVEPKKLSTLVRGEYVFLANVLLQLGQYDDAARIAVKLAPAFPDRWEEQSAAAELLAECGALARDDASLALAERMSLSEGYFALAEVCEEAIGMVPAGSMELTQQSGRLLRRRFLYREHPWDGDNMATGTVSVCVYGSPQHHRTPASGGGRRSRACRSG